ncbi:SPOR domain-containing protein [Methyloraptor flagellatus]|uniref:SPOR domain-containing protein n=1 Tax=Methyloraptor flagellatus TaxID=3162530 RepID=A0AAU7XCS6_9HYPH
MEYTNTTRAPSKADDVVRKDRDTVAPIASGRTGWMIQIGAFDSKGAAEARIDKAKSAGVRELARAEGFTETAAKGGTKIVRARFAGFADQNAANAACSSLKRKDFECIALRQ